MYTYTRAAHDIDKQIRYRTSQKELQAGGLAWGLRLETKKRHAMVRSKCVPYMYDEPITFFRTRRAHGVTRRDTCVCATNSEYPDREKHDAVYAIRSDGRGTGLISCSGVHKRSFTQ